MNLNRAIQLKMRINNLLKWQLGLLVYLGTILLLPSTVFAIGRPTYISTTSGKDLFTLSAAGKSATLCIDSKDYQGVIRALKDLKSDIGKVTNNEPEIAFDELPHQNEVVIVGTLGKNQVIDQLVKNKKLDIKGISGKWEAFSIQIVENPFPGVDKALVIAGSDKRGTIYGIYDLSEQIGVSPWYYWADVPVRKAQNIYVKRGVYTAGEPAVQYRGIFINDEAPALTDWCNAHFGGFNHQFYEKVFELILRLKGNFLWPAMWGKAFYDDDPMNAAMADEYGVVIGTSHHEPMGRAHDEWKRYGKGKWNYDTNPDVLKKYWTEGFKRLGSNESVVTIGMRGDGDEPMSEESNIHLLENIVKDQRSIIADISKKDVSKTPQVWALYKEVQDYYDKGMRVPDDVTLLLCDDNWGNVRKLPLLNAPKRSGGFGMYYHFDYVGGPRNYKWLNTNQIERTWEQMHLSYDFGVDKLWIVNVGDIKPMEYPVSFFLDMAWDPNKWNPENLNGYTISWCKQQFGEKHAAEIAELLASYTKYNARRKPELLSPSTYSLVNYSEAERVVVEYNDLSKRAMRIYDQLPAEMHDAFDQLVLFPIQACANLNEMYVAAGQNKLYAKQGRNNTNSVARKVKMLFVNDSVLTKSYHSQIANGKWNYMMSQTHIGYTNWQQPNVQVMPYVQEIAVPEKADMRLTVEETENFCSQNKDEIALPEFDSLTDQQRYIDIFNGGKTAFDFKIKAVDGWVKISENTGFVQENKRIWVSIDWAKLKTGKHDSFLEISDANGKTFIVGITARKCETVHFSRVAFAESNGCVSIEAEHYSRVKNNEFLSWKTIPNLGRTLSGVTTFPVTAATEAYNGAVLEYDVFLQNSGEAKLTLFLSPTLKYNENKGLRYAVSIDGSEEQIVNFNQKQTDSEWENWAANNIVHSVTIHKIEKPGLHTIRYRVLDAGVVLQKLVLDFGDAKPCYLGVPESKNLFK
jgi:hypothetical protein